MGRLPLLLFLFLPLAHWAQDSLRVRAFDAEDSEPGTMSLFLSPQRLGSGYHAGQTVGESKALWTGMGQAGLTAAAETWSLDVRWEVVRSEGSFHRRAMQAGYDRTWADGSGASRWRARWDWQPLPSLHVALGRDTAHAGWGRRSLFRGRHVGPTPFAEIRIDGGGRLRYQHRIDALRGQRHLFCWPGTTGDPRTWLPPNGPLRASIERMVVSHRLEVDFGQRLTGALWGAVVWNIEDGQRAFEPHYLLPLTSLRPTEYAQGSSDNALVGVEGRLRLGKGGAERPRTLYGQFLLDELIVSELLGGTQWWGNKFGLLGGMDWHTRWGGWRLEATAVRPWTFSHFTSTAAYLHGLTPLAHPLGANFAEAAAEGHWTADKWTLSARLTASVRGDDPTGDTPTGSLPQVGDIDRTTDQYSWLNGTLRHRRVAFLDIARTLTLTDGIQVDGFLQGAVGLEWTEGANALDRTEFWLGLGLRSTGPFFGADW